VQPLRIDGFLCGENGSCMPTCLVVRVYGCGSLMPWGKVAVLDCLVKSCFNVLRIKQIM